MNNRRKLKPTAVPSLFEKQPSTFESATVQVSRKRSYSHTFLDDTDNSSLNLSLSFSESSFESHSSDENDCSSTDEHLGLEPYQCEPTTPESHENSTESDSSDEDDTEQLQSTSWLVYHMSNFRKLCVIYFVGASVEIVWSCQL